MSTLSINFFECMGVLFIVILAILFAFAKEATRKIVECSEFLAKLPHWISVEDELPKINHNDSEWEFSDDVIVYLKDGDIAVGRYERDNSIGEHYWVLYGEDKDLIVTHWMPLPAPPRGSSGKPNNCKKGGEK